MSRVLAGMTGPGQAADLGLGSGTGGHVQAQPDGVRLAGLSLAASAAEHPTAASLAVHS